VGSLETLAWHALPCAVVPWRAGQQQASWRRGLLAMHALRRDDEPTVRSLEPYPLKS
jgi:hypothetical protein